MLYYIDGKVQQSTINITDDTTSTVITGLMEFQLYYISVAAVNSIGAGPYSEERKTFIYICECAPTASTGKRTFIVWNNIVGFFFIIPPVITSSVSTSDTIISSTNTISTDIISSSSNDTISYSTSSTGPLVVGLIIMGIIILILLVLLATALIWIRRIKYEYNRLQH